MRRLFYFRFRCPFTVIDALRPTAPAVTIERQRCRTLPPARAPILISIHPVTGAEKTFCNAYLALGVKSSSIKSKEVMRDDIKTQNHSASFASCRAGMGTRARRRIG
jgi:hypothetical protein